MSATRHSHRACGGVFCNSCAPVKRPAGAEADASNACLCTSCVSKAASDSADEYPWSPSRAVPEVEDLTGLIAWEEESEQQA